MNQNIFCCLLIIFSTANLIAQQDTTSSAEEVIEKLLETIESEETDNSLYEGLEELKNNPINLNNASIFELQRIPFISSHTAEMIIHHRTNYGRFFSVNELHLIDGLNDEIIKKIKPFFSVEDFQTKETDTPIIKYSPLIKINLRTRVQSDFQKERGYSEEKYLGSPDKSYLRLQGNAFQNYRFGLLLEKDPGENSYTDFNSFFMSAKNLSPIDELIAGDYLIEFGQGLSLWSPYGFSKSSEAVLPVKKNPKGIKAYTSTDENRFFRGAAAKINLNNYFLTIFYSANWLDSRIDSTSALILSLPVDGYHRTINEIEKKDRITEKSGGLIIHKSFSNYLKLGLLYYYSQFSNNFFKDDIFSQDEGRFNSYSFSYDFNIQPFNFIGEASMVNNKIATLNGFLFQPTSAFSYSFLIRYYPADYINLHGSGFGESGLTKNEIGIYTGIKWKTFLGVINLYFDQFRFPYKTYNASLPSSGYEVLFDLTSKPLSNLITRIKFKYESKEIDIKSAQAKQLFERQKYQLRGEFTYKVSKSINMKNRFEYALFKLGDLQQLDDGFLMFTDLKFNPSDEIQTAARFIFFKTKNYNSVIYQYESDLTGVMTNLPLYGEGIRWYFMIKYNIISSLRVSIKYSETIRNNVTSIGTGYAEIIGGLDNKISLQIDFNY